MKMRRSLAVILATFLIIGILSPLAGAWTSLGFIAKERKVISPYAGLTTDTVTHMGNAISQWNSVSGTSYNLFSIGASHLMTYYPNTYDGVNGVFKMNEGWNAYVGQCSYRSSGNTLIEFDINFNMYHTFANSQAVGAFDTYSIFLHETGHAAGLNHSNVSTAVMWPTSSTNTLKRYLQLDDINGIKAIYKNTSSFSENVSDGGTEDIISVSGILREMTMDDLITESQLITYGTVIGVSEPFEIIGVTGGVKVFTDYYVQLQDVFRGESVSAEVITIRQEGGTIPSNVIYVVEDAPKLELGDSYLWFLARPNMGSGFNTEGDYYYIQGVNQGIFEVNLPSTLTQVYTDTHGLKSLMSQNVDIKMVSHSGEASSLIETTSYITRMNDEYPVEESYYLNTFLENLEANLRHGFITEEEYQQYLSETQQYAQIMEE